MVDDQETGFNNENTTYKVAFKLQPPNSRDKPPTFYTTRREHKKPRYITGDLYIIPAVTTTATKNTTIFQYSIFQRDSIPLQTQDN